MKKETLQMIGMVAGVLAGMILFTLAVGVIVWAFPAPIFGLLAIADNCLQWAADRQIPVWIGAFALQTMSTYAWDFRFNGIKVRKG